MNKKGIVGFASNFIFGMIGIFVLMIVLSIMIGVQEGRNDYDESKVVLKTLQSNFSETFEPEKLNIEDYNSDLMFSVMKVIYSMIHFVLYVTIEVCLAALDFSIENTDWINPKLLIFVVMASLLAPIFIVLFKIMIIIVILVREFLQSKRDKKNMKQLKTLNSRMNKIERISKEIKKEKIEEFNDFWENQDEPK